MADFDIYRGLLQNLNNVPIVDGNIIITKDDGTLFHDIGSKRIQIGNKNILLELGEGKNSIQHINSKALSKDSFAFGEGAIAGCRGYYFTNIDLVNKIIYIDNYLRIWPEDSFSTEQQRSIPRLLERDEQILYRDSLGYDILTTTDAWYGINDFESGYEIGDYFSICNGGHYDLIAIITNIDGNRIYYDGSLIFTSIAEGEENEPDGYSFFVPDKPTIGSRQLGFKALSIGSNYATGSYSVALGVANKAHGDYSLVAGGGNLGVYGCAVFGTNNEARKHACLVTGASNITYALHSALLGYGLRNTNEDATVVGKYNDEKEKNLLFTVGNGTNFSNKSNAFTVDKDGNIKAKNSIATTAIYGEYSKIPTMTGTNLALAGRVNLGTDNTINQTVGYVGGSSCNVNSLGSFAHGLGLQSSSSRYSAAFGRYNKTDNGMFFEVGIGTSENDRRNGLSLDKDGNLKVAGTITDGQGNTLNNITPAKYITNFVTETAIHPDGGNAGTWKITTWSDGTKEAELIYTIQPSDGRVNSNGTYTTQLTTFSSAYVNYPTEFSSSDYREAFVLNNQYAIVPQVEDYNGTAMGCFIGHSCIAVTSYATKIKYKLTKA